MIAIKDMEMPKSCYNCDFCCAKDDYYCAISKQRLARKVADIPSENRPTDCPLVEIITCQDCKHRIGCKCESLNLIVGDNGYCSNGERRE